MVPPIPPLPSPTPNRHPSDHELERDANHGTQHMRCTLTVHTGHSCDLLEHSPEIRRTPQDTAGCSGAPRDTHGTLVGHSWDTRKMPRDTTEHYRTGKTLTGHSLDIVGHF